MGTPPPEEVKGEPPKEPEGLYAGIKKAIVGVFMKNKEDEKVETKDGVALGGEKKAGELEVKISDTVVNKLDIVERQLRDEQASKRQLQLGRNPNIRTTPYDINMAQVLAQFRIKTSHAELVKYDTKLKKPDHRNLRYVDPFL